MNCHRCGGTLLGIAAICLACGMPNPAEAAPFPSRPVPQIVVVAPQPAHRPLLMAAPAHSQRVRPHADSPHPPDGRRRYTFTSIGSGSGPIGAPVAGRPVRGRVYRTPLTAAA